MIRTIAFSLLAAAASLAASTASAEQYVDYTPEKGVWQVTAIEVDPSHIDDYLTGLRKSQVPGFEIMKKRGIIDAYRYRTRGGYTKGSPNVLIEAHYTSVAMIAPDKARDQSIEKEILATMSKEAGDAAVAGYEKYRQFLDDALWTEITYPK